MSEPRTLARPYAKAAFEFARQHDVVQAWHDALSLGAAVASSDAASAFVGDPRISDAELKALFEPRGETPKGYENFLNLLVHNDRLSLLPELAELYGEFREAAERKLSVKIRAANPISEDQREKFRAALAKRTQREIELEVESDPDLIGGAVVHAGDMVIDSSVRGRLDRMAQALTN